MNIINFLENCVEKYPIKIALVDEERNLTFQQLYQEVQNFSSRIAFLNKNVISLIAENSLSFIIGYLGIINSGKIAHLIPPEISEFNLLNQIRSADSEAIICSNTAKKKILNYTSIKIPLFEFSEIKSQSASYGNNFKVNDLAYLIYTSGTTSEPDHLP